MRTPIAERLGAEFPIFGFSHCRDVVAAVTNAGGIGIFGAIGSTPERLEQELSWIDDQVKGKPYGVDIVLPASTLEDRQMGTPEAINAALEAMIPPGHHEFVEAVLARYGVPDRECVEGRSDQGKAGQRKLVEVALGHHASRLLVNALGPIPRDVADEAHREDVLVGGLVGTPDQARKQVANGADLVVAQGTEAGGHCGEIATMVLTPQVVDAVAPVPVLAAGGIATGRQIAAAIALGAQGAWTGSVWMTVNEAATEPVLRKRLLAATSLDTRRSKSLTGKPNRLLKSAWTEAWEQDDAPEPLTWPLQMRLSGPAMARWNASGNRDLATTSIGQVIGMVNEPRSARHVVLQLVEEFIAATERLTALVAAD